MLYLGLFFLLSLIMISLVLILIFLVFNKTNENNKLKESKNSEDIKKEITEIIEYKKNKKLKFIGVYFVNAFINLTHFERLMQDQLPESLINDFDEYHVVISCPENTKIPSFIQNNNKITIHINHKDVHEYPGIHLLWELSQTNDINTIFLYHHSKGITRIDENTKYKRDELEQYFYNFVIKNRHNYLFEFLQNEKFNKVGYAPSKDGCIWHNYYFVKNNYLKLLKEPTISYCRYCYEHWLANGTYKDCMSLFKPNFWFDNIKNIYHPY
jgi:hypothetical protein